MATVGFLYMVYILCAAYNFGRRVQADYLNMGYEFIKVDKCFTMAYGLFCQYVIFILCPKKYNKIK